jgi:hypothetical protein
LDDGAHNLKPFLFVRPQGNLLENDIIFLPKTCLDYRSEVNSMVPNNKSSDNPIEIALEKESGLGYYVTFFRR